MNEPRDTRGNAKKAVALRYNAGNENAPRVIAKGERLVAERIIELAREHNIHVHEDPDLVSVLSAVDLHAEIPENLYRAVAEILAFVYRLNKLSEQRRA
ncbi:MAG: EscU/YscU/HrcU family type III secretion system export apparatus switch protein [Candidatus Hydrogenedentes bacterium]|nr:EscU/YscU/HrcU family type III secretion system export apparatus switch protein [Candidatus Hydrogenedentota bacterium]